MSTVVQIKSLLEQFKSKDLKNFQDEIWIPITDFEGVYSISNYTRVKRHKVYFFQKHRNGKVYKNYHPERILKQNISKRGYYTLTLSHNNTVKRAKIHRLMAFAFLNSINGKNHVNHKNGIKTDNRIENLEWCTNRENILHSYRKLGRKSNKGKKNNGVAKTVYQYSKDGLLIKKHRSCKDAAEELGKDLSNIASCARGVTKYAYGFKWIYK